MSRPYVRRLLLVDRSFQLGLAAFFFALQVALLALFAGLLHLFVRSELEANLQSARVAYRNLGDQLLPIVLTLGLLDAVIAAVAITVFVVVRTHRIAGPLYRIQEAVEELRARDLTPHTALRDGDQLGPLADSLRGLVDVLQQDHARRDAALDALEGAVRDGAGPDRILPLLKAVRAVSDDWKA